MGVLDGVKVVEFAGMGPAPVCGMLLADMGADVIVIDRPGESPPAPSYFVGRGKRSIALDLKDGNDASIARRLAARADIVLEGFRPGVMERLGLGPEALLAERPSLVYGRMTGWGQEGPLAQTAGHDANYICLAGAFQYACEPGGAPHLPATLLGDIGGGSLFLLSGVLAALLHARATGEGQVVDAAIVDGVANLMTLMLATSGGEYDRGVAPLDIFAPWSRTYRCADGGFMKVQAREDKFFVILLRLLGLDAEFSQIQRHDRSVWRDLERRMGEVFASAPRAHWETLFDGTDACVTPVLRPDEAERHPHNRARGTFLSREGRIEPAPAPRFSRTPSARPGLPPRVDADRDAILAELAGEPQ